MNDPNGLVFYEGEYHLFFQHHPHSSIWGPMHWGHAVSRDLLHWENLPIALYPDEIGQIWSGSVVVDAENTSGLVPGGGLIAVFSYNNQSQGVAYSTDRGRTWGYYAGNPVIPAMAKDFRDPKVFWHPETQRWVMVLAVGKHARFFNSPDLLNWTLLSRFDPNLGDDYGTWECPDLFPLTLEGKTYWVLLISLEGAPTGGRSTQYFIGQFDGQTFTPYPDSAKGIWMDYGRDNYAGVTWNNLPEDQRVFIGWMSDWQYAKRIPTPEWRGAMTLPRRLTLRQEAKGLRLRQTPIPGLSTLRKASQVWQDCLLMPGENPLSEWRGLPLEIDLTLEFDEAIEIGITVAASVDGSQTTLIHYGVADQRLSLDRRKSGAVDFSPSFSGVHAAPLKTEGHLRLQVVVDWSSVEVFANDGAVVITDQIFPDPSGDHVSLFVRGGSARIRHLAIYELVSVWG
jgi:fructan beta-fructosidase